MRAFACVCVPVGVRVCQFCKTRHWRYWFLKSPRVSRVNVVICFVSPLRDAKVWGSALQSLNSSRCLWLCAECVEKVTRQVPCETTGVSPPCCPVTWQFRVKTNGCCNTVHRRVPVIVCEGTARRMGKRSSACFYQNESLNRVLLKTLLTVRDHLRRRKCGTV